jgi:hypothetical protein
MATAEGKQRMTPASLRKLSGSRGHPGRIRVGILPQREEILIGCATYK